MDPDQFKDRINQIYDDLERYSYYELFNLTPQATPDDIRQAFHRMATLVHPDRFEQHQDQDLRRQVYEIYKRMTEGYRVLMDPSDRKAYDAGLARGEIRLVRTGRKITGPKLQEEAIDNPQAKKFFNLAQDAERRGDLKGAQMNFKFALDMAGESELIQSHYDRVSATLAEKEEAERESAQKKS